MQQASSLSIFYAGCFMTKNYWFVERVNQGHLAGGGYFSFLQPTRQLVFRGPMTKALWKSGIVNIVPREHPWHDAVVLFVQPTGHSASEQRGSTLWTPWTSFRRVVSLSKWHQDFDLLFEETWFVIKAGLEIGHFEKNSRWKKNSKLKKKTQ